MNVPDTITSLGVKPIPVNTKVCPEAASILKLPSAFVRVPFEVPLTWTDAPSTGVEFSVLMTLPVTLVWEIPENQEADKSINNSDSFFMLLFLMIITNNYCDFKIPK